VVEARPDPVAARTGRRAALRAAAGFPHGVNAARHVACAAQKHGHGELHYASGDVFSGTWVDDHAVGHGVLRYADGKVFEGEWESASSDDAHTYQYPTSTLTVFYQ
jgi:hypothetical protein